MLIGGETIDSFCHRIFSNRNAVKSLKTIKYIGVDEISMVREYFYQMLIAVKYYNPDIKFIISGDFKQLPPVNDRINKVYERTRALFELSGGNKLLMSKCRRSNSELFNICENVSRGKQIDTSLFAFKNLTDLNVCFTNETRHQINKTCSERFIRKTKPEKILDYKGLSYDKNTSDFKVCIGMPVIARLNSKASGFCNNETFNVKDISDTEIMLNNDLKNEIKIPVEKFNKMFQLAFCITIHKSQGATFDTRYTIFEWDRLNTKLKYVALSRATSMEAIQIK